MAFIVKVFSVSLDKAIFFSPAFLSSLSVIPVIMIGYIYKIVRFSFFVSVIGSITYAYYIRSFLGYYDTDSLNIFFSLMIVAFLIAYVENKKIGYLFGSAVFILLFLLWYHSAKLIVFVIIANFFFYMAIWRYRWIFERKRVFLLLFLFIVILSFIYHEEIYHFFLRAYEYIFKSENIYFIQDDSHKLIFKNTLSTVSEAKALPFYKLGKYLSINNLSLFVSLFALFIFCLRFKSFLLAFSLLVLSFLSLKSGVRFSEYGVYIVPFGTVYILYIIKNSLLYLRVERYFAEAVFISLFLVLSYFYIKAILKRNSSLHPVFSAQSVKMLKALDKNLEKEDYILTWWDYGWPLWYYTKANTLIDNGKHFEDNYIISKLLFSDQSYTYKATKFFMDICNGRRCYLSRNIYKNHSPKEIDTIIKRYKPKKQAKDIYFLFHSRMVKIMKVILDFSKIDPLNGKKSRGKIVKIIKVRHYGNKALFSKNYKIKLDLKEKILKINSKKIPLRYIYLVGRYIKKLDTKHKRAKFYAIVYKNRYIILCNKEVFNSFFIQALVLNNYNKKYFRLVGIGNDIKIIQLKE